MIIWFPRRARAYEPCAAGRSPSARPAAWAAAIIMRSRYARLDRPFHVPALALMRSLHILSFVLFGTALCLYIASSTMSSLVLGGVAICIEAIAWVASWKDRGTHAANLRSPSPLPPKPVHDRTSVDPGDSA